MINKKTTAFSLTKYLAWCYHTSNLLTESPLAFSGQWSLFCLYRLNVHQSNTQMICDKSTLSYIETLSQTNLNIIQQIKQCELLYNSIIILIRQSQDSYQPSQRQLQRQLPRSTMLVQVPNQLRLSEEAIQSDNPRR
ncbi:Hypothetical_protein [Hexamita inflata]|uniref:Hypothetical_protein n=1 Tax=Hexamita inflata TaxID=28002 RepID=A0AA86R457_9EUKA|nr:Hypothetical protein HINF_LOCUS53437 [Hexamita inflata]